MTQVGRDYQARVGMRRRRWVAFIDYGRLWFALTDQRLHYSDSAYTTAYVSISAWRTAINRASLRSAIRAQLYDSLEMFYKRFGDNKIMLGEKIPRTAHRFLHPKLRQQIEQEEHRTQDERSKA